MADHGSTVTPLKDAAWEQVQKLRKSQEALGEDYPPPPGARTQRKALGAGAAHKCAEAGRRVARDGRLAGGAAPGPACLPDALACVRALLAHLRLHDRAWPSAVPQR